jgi:hypothetical protein
LLLLSPASSSSFVVVIIVVVVVVVVVVVLTRLCHRYIAIKPVLWCQCCNSITMLLVFVHYKRYHSSSLFVLVVQYSRWSRTQSALDRRWLVWLIKSGFVSERLHLLKTICIYKKYF